MIAKRYVAGALAVLLAAGLTGCAGTQDQASTTEKRPMTVGVFENYSAYLLFLGEDQGFFTDAGISALEPRLFTSVPAQMTAVAQGQINLGMQTVPALINYNSAGGASQMQMFSSFGKNVISWSAKAGSGLPAAAEVGWQAAVREWKGKIIGVPALGGLVEKNLRYMLNQAGLAPDDVDVVAVGGQQAAVQALRQGVVDIVGGGAAIHAPIDQSEVGYPVLRADEGPAELSDVISAAWFASKKQIADDPEFYAGIVKGIEKTREFIRDPKNRDASVAVLHRDVGLTKEEAEFVYDMDHSRISESPVNRESFEKLTKTLKITGALAGAAPGYDDLVAADIAQ